MCTYINTAYHFEGVTFNCLPIVGVDTSTLDTSTFVFEHGFGETTECTDVAVGFYVGDW